MKNPITYAVPFFLLSILVEVVALTVLDGHDDGEATPGPVRARGYERRDASTSLLMGVGSLVSTTVFKIGSFFVFTAIYAWAAPVHLPTDTWWYWVALVLALDLLFYANHRFVHRVNVGWAAHQAHHSSEYMNFTTALRQKWNPWFELLFWAPLPLLGFAPWTIYLAFAFNLIYQFGIHTELVDRLWRPVEWVFNTPSHHRVHHGSDPHYLDANYGGILIVWDRVFGTFVPERERPTYGLTKPVETFNPFVLQYGHYGELFGAVRRARSWRVRMRLLFGPPGWEPPVETVRPRETAV
ncbi:MAG: C-5 sterol desaturase [Nocardioides sp.]|nr:C-5 sterol desaturase [Nocardioides sp.]